MYYKESLVTVTSVYCLSLVLMYLYQAINRKQNISFILKCLLRVLVILPVAIMVGCRGISTGADTDNNWMDYLRMYDNSLSTAINKSTSDDILYRCLAWSVCRISNANVHVYFTVVALLTLYFVVLTIDKWKLRNSTTALFLFLFCYGPNLCNQMRELLAVSIMLYAYWCLYENKRKVFIFWSAVASLIHLSALVAAIISYLIVVFSKKQKKGNIFYMVLVLVTVFCQPISKLLGSLFFSGTKYYEKYFLEASGMSVGLGMLLTMIPIVIPAFVMHHHLDKEGKILKNISVTIPARLVGYDYYFVSRMHYYFSGMGIIGLPMALDNVPYKNRVFVRIFIIIMAIVYYLSFYFWKDASTYFPYVFIPYWL